MEEEAIVQVEGRIDAASAPLLLERIETVLDTHPDHLIIDLGAASYVSSSGMRVLLIAHRRQQALGGTLALVNTPDKILRVLHIAGFDQVFDLLPSDGAQS